MNSISMYVIINDYFEQFFHNWFVKTFQDKNISLNIKKATYSSGTSYSTEWISFLKHRTEIYLSILKSSKIDDIIIFSDADVQFFQPIENYIIKLIKDYDFLAMREHLSYINGGFLVFRSNEKTIQFLEKVNNHLKIRDSRHVDQDAYNNCLATKVVSGLRFNLLPDTFWCPSGNKILPINIILHHATCVSSLEEKARQMLNIRNKYNNVKNFYDLIILNI